MKIQKIEKITKYKSFKNYSWQKFLNVETLHSKTNIFFGENGSGKSSICNILKSVSQSRDFYKYFPEEAKLKINNNTYEYTNRSWQKLVDHGSLLFFDREFVDENVHLGRGRGTQQGEQEQESAKLIIEFDAEAIKLRKRRDELVEAKENKHARLEEYQSENQTILSFRLTEGEESYFRKYKNKDKSKISAIKKSLEERKSDLENNIKVDSRLQQKVTEIQQIPDVEEIIVDISLSRKAAYQALFNFNLKEKAKLNVQKNLVEKITEQKEFFEHGFEIRKVHTGYCPFCQAKNRESEIKQIIKAYEDLYDDSYKKQKEIFESKKQILIDELENIEESFHNIDLNQIFLTLKKLSEQYSIKNVYSTGEEEQYRKNITFFKVDELKKKILSLKNPNKENASLLYDDIKNEFVAVKKLLNALSKFIVRKNNLIRSFKKEHTDSKLQDRIQKNQTLLTQFSSELGFINSNKLDSEKLKQEKLKTLQKFQKDLEKAKESHKSIRDKYEEYCSTDAFSKTLTKIESYFQFFDFGFKLQLDTQNRHTGSTKELPFAFKVLDLEGIERDLREGLSEGEVQVLSLCFFFAFLDIQGGKDQKILVFDDPITSLDDSNLSNLVDLIAKEKDSFSQIAVLTHHGTFFKFLRKRFGEKCNEYLILRNKQHLGGSFICKSREERFLGKLKNFESHLLQIAQNPTGFDIELKVVEYGQYLRYETEYFIKCRLLYWDKSSNFTDVIDGIKQNKKIKDTDLDQIKQIYSFCNWTTSHVDVGDDHGLAQLKEKITVFIRICDRYKSNNLS